MMANPKEKLENRRGYFIGYRMISYRLYGAAYASLL